MKKVGRGGPRYGGSVVRGCKVIRVPVCSVWFLFLSGPAQPELRLWTIELRVRELCILLNPRHSPPLVTVYLMRRSKRQGGDALLVYQDIFDRSRRIEMPDCPGEFLIRVLERKLTEHSGKDAQR